MMYKFLFCLLLLAIACAKKPFFKDTEAFYKLNTAQKAPASAGNTPFVIKKFNEGFYAFSICQKEILYKDELFDWFCYCNDPEKTDTMETIALLFIDEVRCLFFKNPYDYFDTKKEADKGVIQLDHLNDKLMRVGLYHFEPNGAGTGLSLHLRPLKAKDPDASYSELLLHANNTRSLQLKTMFYPDNDQYLNRSRNRSKTALDGILGQRAMRPIAPDSVFALKDIHFSFVAQPFLLKIVDCPIETINYGYNEKGIFTRTYIRKDHSAWIEIPGDTLSVKSW
jgi:hypothetical protein